MSTQIKPSHKAILAYYQTLKDLAAQNVSHEMGLRRAFQTLLADTARLQDWTLVTEDASKTTTGTSVRPDATLRDKNTLPRGFWEAKDPGDDLAKEIAKKSAKGYSLSNTIFENSQIALLYQNKKLAMEADLSNPEQLSGMLNLFYSHTEPDFQNWEAAVNDFKDRVPDLAKGLVTIIETAHKKNTKFKKAFEDFYTLCQTSLNPNIAQAAVDEMLIQHILTERLFRTIFNAADFTQRNVIAAEVEKVITALSSGSFSREEYLKSLDRFYLAIEMAARHLEWTEKQHFLNTIYERFFQGYSVKTADTMGIVYTPQEIVDFMCASVVEVLKSEFNKDLGDPDVFVLDPCTGTGNFIVNLLRRIPPKKLPQAYANNFFANEIMLMPYYIAALNIEHAYYELAGTYEAFEGLCFVDTLDLAESTQTGFDFFTQRNTERVERQRKTPITIVIGNPPYNAHQINENDNNKNRAYKELDKRIKETYGKDSRATLKAALADMYVKFFRFAVDRLGDRDGIVCFVTNNSFVDQNAFDGMRKHMARDFTSIYHLDLEGNVRHNPTLSGTAYNVFGIQVGVGITIAVRQKKPFSQEVLYAKVDLNLRRQEKLSWLHEIQSRSGVIWNEIIPEPNGTWLNTGNNSDFSRFIPISARDSNHGANDGQIVFETYCPGVNSSRDDVVYSFSSEQLAENIPIFCENYAAELDRLHRKGIVDNIDDKIDYSKLKWSSGLKIHAKRGTEVSFDKNNICDSLYRPFTRRAHYYDRVLNDRPSAFNILFPDSAANAVIALTNAGSEKPFMALACKWATDYHLVGAGAGAMCFPFYTYNEDGTNRRENITDWALTQFRDHYHDKKISKWDIFYYVYGILHHPAYREKFADNLKRELPRIPFAPPWERESHDSPSTAPRAAAKSKMKNQKSIPKNTVASEPSVSSVVKNDLADGFWAFSKAGKQLADLHLNYESAKEFPLTEIITPGTPRSPRVESKMKFNKDKTALDLNPSLRLAGIPPETFHYKLGNRSALDWIVDQYQVYTDPRTQITSDPNAWGEEHDNPEYIPQLIAKIITVSLETQKIVSALPAEFAESGKS